MSRVTIHNPNSLDLLDIDLLNTLQGDFKQLDGTGFKNLLDSINKHGFSFPIKVWTNENGIHYIIGGHQRLKVLKKAFNDCIVIDYINTNEGLVETNETNYDRVMIPIEFVRAADRREAIKLLLLDDSRFGKTNKDSSFLKDEGESGFDFSGLQIHDVNFSEFAPDMEGVLDTGGSDELSMDDIDNMLKQQEMEMAQLGNSEKKEEQVNIQSNTVTEKETKKESRIFNMEENKSALALKSNNLTFTIPLEYIQSVEVALADIPILSIGNEKEQVKRGRRLIKLLLNEDVSAV